MRVKIEYYQKALTVCTLVPEICFLLSNLFCLKSFMNEDLIPFYLKTMEFIILVVTFCILCLFIVLNFRFLNWICKVEFLLLVMRIMFLVTIDFGAELPTGTKSDIIIDVPYRYFSIMAWRIVLMIMNCAWGQRMWSWSQMDTLGFLLLPEDWPVCLNSFSIPYQIFSPSVNHLLQCT